MLSKTTEDFLRDIGKLLGSLAWQFGFDCLRAWLVGMSAASLAPSLALGFWQWLLIVVTVRLLFLAN